VTDAALTSDLRILLITGMSGSGKSVAIRALEDMGYYCVDNLPPQLFEPLVKLVRKQHTTRIAVAMDVRSALALPLVPEQLNALREQGVQIDSVFLDASTETLLRRFSETRRSHPLSQENIAPAGLTRWRVLLDAIELEREMLGILRDQSHVIDTSVIRPSQLQSYIKSFVGTPQSQLTLAFESFAYKRGIPTDADFVFDVRMLTNPYYEPELRTLTGQDQAVANFLQADTDVRAMQSHITAFLDRWLDTMAKNHRSYVTVAVGCTGGQHRSVYLVEQLAATFQTRWNTLKRHRELDARQAF
jgi:UPF0042 nucleotide-binding protein